MTEDFSQDPLVQAVLERLENTKDLSDFERTIETAARLSPEAREYIAAHLEEKMPSFVKDGLDDRARQELRSQAAIMAMMRYEGTLSDDIEMVSVILAALTQAAAFIIENGGDAVSPITRAFAKEAAQLSDKEYSLPENLMLLICRASEKVQGVEAMDTPMYVPMLAPGAQVKKNPFRAKNKPAPAAMENPEARAQAEARLKALKDKAPARPRFKK